jgi:hypothetical protein
MAYFNGNLAREVGRLTGWTDRLWSRRYDSILVSDEEAAQFERLQYHLAQGVKEGLVASPLEWPGVHCAQALLTGEPIAGTWHNRTLAHNARLRRKSLEPWEADTRETVNLSQLPCWNHLEREKSGVEPLGAEQVEAQDPETRPETLDRSPAPFVHAATRKIRKEIWEAYRWFVAVYREASEKLRNGDRNAAFPPGSFPPHLPFVPA